MEIIKFLEENKNKIDTLELIGENYYYRCLDVGSVVVEEKSLELNNLRILLNEECQVKEDIEDEQKIYYFNYKDFVIKCTMKKMVVLAELLKEKKDLIKKVEVLGDSFYHICNDSSKIIFKEDTESVMLGIDRLILTLSKEEFLSSVLEDYENVYNFNFKNFDLKISTENIIRIVKMENSWDKLNEKLKSDEE